MDFAAARHNMVESQIRPNRVTDERIMEAMAELPREAFLPEDRRGIAYVDDSIPLGDGRCAMEPMVLARLLQTAELKTDDVVLSIGCASGYEAAVLARIVNTVVAVESDKALAQSAARVLGEQEIDNVAIIEGELAAGYPKQGPYDVVFLSGAVPDVPETISSQLGEGGRLVGVITSASGVGRGTLITRHGDARTERQVFDAGLPELPGFGRTPAFAF